jgi:hypothetical protein
MENAMNTVHRTIVGLLALVGGAACTDSSTTAGGGPGPLPLDSLTLLRLTPAAVPLVCTDSIGFWVFKGGQRVDTALVIGTSGDPCPGGEDFIRLKLDQASLATMPDGTPIANGDSVFISMIWVGGDSVLFHLEPSGLQFDPSHPAELRIDYGETEEVDDSTVIAQIAIWRQPTLADPFTRLNTTNLGSEQELEVKLNGFSRYAIAY